MTEINEGVVAPEATKEGTAETVSIAKADYEALNQTLGSLKRELKDLKKSKETTEAPSIKNESTSEGTALLEKVEKLALRSAGISHPDDIDLARKTAKKWNMDIDDVLADDDFKVKLERQQTDRSNTEATSGVKGDGATSSAKNTAEYWMAKGTPPSPEQVSDRKTRAKIINAMRNSGGGKGNFYNS